MNKLRQHAIVPAVLALGAVSLWWMASARRVPVERLDGLSYTGAFLDVSRQVSGARATFWKPDGTLLYVVGRDTGNVAAYELERPWDIRTARYRMGAELGGRFLHGLFLRDDGTRMWVFDRRSIWSYELHTAWDITTIDAGRSTCLRDVVRRGHDMDFHPDGARIFIDDRTAGAVVVLSLSEPWEVASGQREAALDMRGVQRAVRGIEFIRDGRVLLLLDTGRAGILVYRLAVPYDVTSARLAGLLDVKEQTRNPRGLSVSGGLEWVYVTCATRNRIFQYRKVASP